MRIRSTKPEFWRSKRIAAVDWDARLVLKGLESYVDDNGVGKDDVALIVSDVFPHDMYVSPQETAVRVQTAIGVLNQAGLVWRYEADGTDLLYVSWWDTTQLINRPSKGRFRRPDGTWNYRDSEITECSVSPHGAVSAGTGEQGNRGTVKEREPARGDLTLIPDDWQPGLGHQAKAKSLGIADINAAAEAFRNHALSEARQSANWDAAFHSWLGSPKTRAAERERNNTTGRRQATSDLAFANTQALKDNTDRLELEP